MMSLWSAIKRKKTAAAAEQRPNPAIARREEFSIQLPVAIAIFFSNQVKGMASTMETSASKNTKTSHMTLYPENLGRMTGKQSKPKRIRNWTAQRRNEGSLRD